MEVYTHSNPSFSFDYPKGWQIDETDSSILVYVEAAPQGQRYQITIIINENPDLLSAQEFAMQQMMELNHPATVSIGEVGVGNSVGYGLTNVFASDETDEKLYVRLDDMMLVISYPTAFGNESVYNPEQNYQVARDIVRSFVINSNQLTNIQTNTNIQKSDVISFQQGNPNSKLLFSQVGLGVAIPNFYYQVTEDEISQYNNAQGEYIQQNACRGLSINAEDSFKLWFSFDEFTDLCGTERFFSSVSEPQYDFSDEEFCEQLSLIPSLEYNGCGAFADPPKGFTGYSYFQFIPDYGGDGTGTIVREVYLRGISDKRKEIIVGYLPSESEILWIKEYEFEDYINRIDDGEFSGFLYSSQAVKTFESVVRSLEVT